jgi:hypothetical protein
MERRGRVARAHNESPAPTTSRPRPQRVARDKRRLAIAKRHLDDSRKAA